ncbi:hypothetical protein GCM10023213_35760 [Prosthecobacter algae]|uniref:Uncharacterized protein n=1 Tax=Prosthecobacter algae TaxID=1144682 RepID=A0ABP9PFF3_9BACT
MKCGIGFEAEFCRAKALEYFSEGDVVWTSIVETKAPFFKSLGDAKLNLMRGFAELKLWSTFWEDVVWSLFVETEAPLQILRQCGIGFEAEFCRAKALEYFSEGDVVWTSFVETKGTIFPSLWGMRD